MSIITDNNKTLEGTQTALKASYAALAVVEDRFKRRKEQKTIEERKEKGMLVQAFDLGTDRKVTSPGYISCVSDVDGKPTTTNINYSLLYQNVPNWSASAGVLVTFQEKKVIGVENDSDAGSSPPTSTPFFRVTDRAQAQVFPMGYVNYRISPYWTTHYGSGKEDDLIWTIHLSGGLGINPNTGTNQPEFFKGLALGLNRLMIHPGIHWGRTESLAGGFVLDTQAPSGVSNPPISWSYHPAFSIGFSVRVAPY